MSGVWFAGAVCIAFMEGDAVPMMRRTLYGGQQTEWNEVPSYTQPRFLRDRTATLEQIHRGDLLPGQPLKISFALHGLRFATPWIVVADGDGRFLSQLEFRLTALGDELAAVRWETQYDDEEPPAHIIVRTVWDHATEHDLGAALTLAFAVAATTVLLLLWCTCARHGLPAVSLLFAEEPEPHRHQLKGPPMYGRSSMSFKYD